MLNKTEITVLKKKRIQTILPGCFGEEVVETMLAAKYLEVFIDSKLCSWEQIHSRADRAVKGVTVLSRLMTIISKKVQQPMTIDDHNPIGPFAQGGNMGLSSQ